MNLTRAKLFANRKNSQLSPGPITPEGKAAASQNARRHGLLARTVVFQSEEEEATFDQLQAGLFDSWKPVNLQEEMLVEQIVLDYWKLGILTKRILADLQRGEDSSVTRRVMNGLAGGSALPAGDPTAQGTGEIHMGLVCDYVVMRVSKGKRCNPTEPSSSESSDTSQFEAKIENAFRLALRYEGVVKNDLYTAIERLQKLQKGRPGDIQTKPKP